MTYDESTFRRRDSDSTDTVGLRDDSTPRFHRSPYRTGGFSAGERADAAARDSNTAMTRGAQLENVFDDPEHGDPGRDRLGVHMVVEILLLVATVTLAILLYRADSGALRGAQLDDLLVRATAFGLLALGAGMSLRAGVPNLAIGPAAVIAAVFFAHEGNEGVLPSTGVAVGAAAGAGLVLALFVVVLHVPTWAASLAAALGGIVWIQQVDGPVTVTGGFEPANRAVYLFAAFAAAAVIIAALGTGKGARRAIGRFRPVADPAQRRGGLAGALATLALIGSMVLAAVAGVLFAANAGPTVTAGPGVELTGLALGMALLGGTSAFGRRGGIFGTLLAAVLLTLFIRYDSARGWDISLYAIAAVMLAGGLVVTRLVEAFGRPDPWGDGSELDDTGWVTSSASSASGLSSASGASGTDDLTSSSGLGRPPRTDSWSSAPPTQPTNGRGDAWDDDRWG